MRLLFTLVLSWLGGLAALVGDAAPASAAARLELRLEGDRLEAMIIGEPKREPVYLRDVAHQRRIPALQVQSAPGAPDQFTATFDAETLEGDGKPRELAIEWNGTELARTSFVLPAPQKPSSLRYLVIIGPLIGLVMIGVAVWIGRRTLARAEASEPRRRPFQ